MPKSFSRKDLTTSWAPFVKPDYIKKLNLGEMVAQGMKGLYRYTETPLPDDIKKKLANAKDLSDADVKDLLMEARMPLGKREDLSDETKTSSSPSQRVPSQIRAIRTRPISTRSASMTSNKDI